MAVTLSATGLAAALMITEEPPTVTQEATGEYQEVTEEESDLW